MNNVLDDLSLDDIKNAHKADDDGIQYKKDADDIQILEVFCNFPKGKNTLLFAQVMFGNYERYDIRLWYDDASKPGKGMAFTKDELLTFYSCIRNRDIAKYDGTIRAHYESEKVHADVFERICLLSDYSLKGIKWNKEISIVDWGYGPKYDFRKWTDDYSKCGKGIAVSFEEMENIYSKMHELFIEQKIQ